MQMQSQRHQSNDHTSSSSDQTQSCAVFNDSLEEDPPSADSSQTVQCEIDGFTPTIQDLDNELKQAEKKRNLLLKKCHLTSVQREIQVLQCQDVDELLVDNSSDTEVSDNSSILKHTQFTFFIKRSAENYLSVMMFKRNIHSEHLNTYTEKSVQEHLNFIHSVKTVFCLTLKNFTKDEVKILYIMQFLVSEP